jgi:hypothetical protein
MALPNYRCSQQDLYTVTNLAWQSCLQHQAAFFNFSELYTEAFIQGKIQQVLDASNLPDEQARSSQSEILRIDLSKSATANLGNWQKLKRYISKAWAEEYQKARLEEAGQKYYLKAGNEDWESVKGLLSSGSNFIDNNVAALTANLNMPASFQTTFDDDKATFFQLHQQFLDSEESVRIETDNKINANNAVYKDNISMCLDGQEIFKDNEAVKRQFVFDQLLNLASGTGTAGIRGTVTDSATNLPIENVNLTFQEVDKGTTTDQDGKYIITQVAAGDYHVVITANGYQTQTISQKVKVGTISTLNIQLVLI